MTGNIVKIGDQNVDIGLTESDAEIIKAKTPVRTGECRDGFIAEDGEITNAVKHSIFVELGTGPFYKGELGPGSGQPWGFPGRYMVQRSMQQIADAIIDRVLSILDIRKMLKIPDEFVINIKGSITGGGPTRRSGGRPRDAAGRFI